MFTDIRRADAYDLTTLSVALRQLRNLVLDHPTPHGHLTATAEAVGAPGSERLGR